MEGVDDAHGEREGAGQYCPAQQSLEGASPGAIIVDGQRLEMVQATEEEQAAILAILSKRAESPAASPRAGCGSALARAGVKIAAILFLAAGVGAGLGGGDELDGEGCSVAKLGRRTSQQVHSGQLRDRRDDKLAGPDGGSDGGSRSGGSARRPECEARAAMCAHRMPDGQCQMSKRQCRLFADAGEVRDMVAGIHREIAAVRAEREVLLTSKARLDQMAAEGLLKFAGRIDPASFKVIYAVLGKGDVAKAARNLGMKDSTLRQIIRRWTGRGKDYAVLADLVRWRKETKFRGTVPLNEAVLSGEGHSADHAALLSDALDGLLEMTQGNWQDKCDELAEMLRPHVKG